jgi:tetratricopeptide (TPR) repeat protein
MTDIYVANRAGSGQVAQWMSEAIGHFQANRLQEADGLCRRMAEAEPGNAAIFNLWAAVLLQGGQPDGATQLLARAIELDGGQREYHHNLGNILREMGRPGEAETYFRTALRLAPQAVDSCFELGLCLLDLGRPADAAAFFKAAVVFAPGVTDGYFRLGVCELQIRANPAAIANFRYALRCQPDLSDAHTNLGIVLREEGAVGPSVEEFRRSLVLRPDDPFIVDNYGNALQDLDQEEQRIGVIERAVQLAPFHAEPHYTLAMLDTYERGDWRLEALERLAGYLPQLSPESQVFTHFALSKVYEDFGDKEQSFRHQVEANAIKRSLSEYNETSYLRGVRRIKAAFTPEVIAKAGGSGTTSDLPIFIVGMARSGSTLIEQILASHPAVFGAGELPNFPLLARELGTQGNRFPEFVAEMTDEDFKRIGSTYLEQLRAKAPKARHIVDKLPENYRMMGLIHCALPGAKIVHSRRDAIDTCLSIYSKLFTGDLPYSYKLDEIGRYWRAYDELMQHWRAVLPPGSFYDLDYEKLVADQEGETRKLLEFCGVEWNDAVLQFHKTKRLVRTASSAQVKKPLYASSVGRWRPAPEQLAPLMAGLAGR